MQAVERVVEVSTLRHYASSLLGGREESQGLEVEFPFFLFWCLLGLLPTKAWIGRACWD